MHVSCRGRGILELDLNSVFTNEEERVALAIVKSLDLSHNELKQIQGLQPFSSLTTLDLQHNKLVHLQGLPLSLQRLTVSHNQLTSLEGLMALPFLQELDAEDNKLSSLQGLPRTLRVLRVARNRLSTCGGLEPLLHLEVLDLQANYLPAVQDLKPLSTLPSLTALWVRGNALAESPSYIISCAQLIPSVQSVDGQPVKRQAQIRPPSPQQGPLQAFSIQAQSQSSAIDLASQQRIVQPAAERGMQLAPQRELPSQPRRTSSVPKTAFAGRNQPAAGFSSIVSSRHQTQQSSILSQSAIADATYGDDAEQRAEVPAVNRSALSGRRPDGVVRPSRDSVVETAPLNMSVNTTTAGEGLSTDAAKRRALARKTELPESKKKLELECTELRRLLEEEYKLTHALQKGKKKAESDLGEARRVLAEELQKLNAARAANRELEIELEAERKRAQKFSREYQYAHQKLKEERRLRTEESEKARIALQTVTQSLKSQIAALEDSKGKATESSAVLRCENVKLQAYIEVLERENRQLAMAVSMGPAESSSPNGRRAAPDFSLRSGAPVKSAACSPPQVEAPVSSTGTVFTASSIADAIAAQGFRPSDGASSRTQLLSTTEGYAQDPSLAMVDDEERPLKSSSAQPITAFRPDLPSLVVQTQAHTHSSSRSSGDHPVGERGPVRFCFSSSGGHDSGEEMPESRGVPSSLNFDTTQATAEPSRVSHLSAISAASDMLGTSTLEDYFPSQTSALSTADASDACLNVQQASQQRASTRSEVSLPVSQMELINSSAAHTVGAANTTVASVSGIGASLRPETLSALEFAVSLKKWLLKEMNQARSQRDSTEGQADRSSVTATAAGMTPGNLRGSPVVAAALLPGLEMPTSKPSAPSADPARASRPPRATANSTPPPAGQSRSPTS
eukprot:RCo055038